MIDKLKEKKPLQFVLLLVLVNGLVTEIMMQRY